MTSASTGPRRRASSPPTRPPCRARRSSSWNPGHRAGGLSSGGLGQTDIGNKQAVEGLSLDFYRRVGQHYGELEKWIFEPSVALDIFNDYITRGGVDVLYGHRILSTDKQGTRIESIRLQNTDKCFGRTVVRAKQYIDCSYEGDLMARAGVTYVVGREDNATYGETWNGVHMRPTHQFPRRRGSLRHRG